MITALWTLIDVSCVAIHIGLTMFIIAIAVINLWSAFHPKGSTQGVEKADD